MKIVQFRCRYRLWNAGERAGFPDDVAAQFVAQGVAFHVPVGDKKIRSGPGAQAAAPALHPSAADEPKLSPDGEDAKPAPAGKTKPAPAGKTKPAPAGKTK